MQLYDAIVLAAGRGTRMGAPRPKQFLRLAGKPLVIHVLELLERRADVAKVVVAHTPGMEEAYRELIHQYGLRKPVLVEGAATRQWSLTNALGHVETERLIVHEAVRPFVRDSVLDRVLSHSDPAVVPTVPIPFTVSAGREFMDAELDRSRLHNIQLPQAFDTAILREAHERFREPGDATEDSLLVFRLGHQVRFVEGDELNIKITTPFDMKLAELIYNELWQ